MLDWAEGLPIATNRTNLDRVADVLTLEVIEEAGLIDTRRSLCQTPQRPRCVTNDRPDCKLTDDLPHRNRTVDKNAGDRALEDASSKFIPLFSAEYRCDELRPN